MCKKTLTVKTKKRAHRFRLLLMLICVLIGILSSCSNMSSTPNTDISSPASNDPLSAPSKEISNIDMSPSFRLPLVGYFTTWCFSDPLPDNVVPQLICNDETALRLALKVQQLLPMGVNSLPFFDSETPLDTTAAVKIALANTAPIDLSGSSFTEKEGFRWDKYPDHPITVRLSQIWKEGDSPTDVFYSKDVSATVERLFGIMDLPHCTVDWYHYFPEEGVYIMYGEMVWGKNYPQILSYQKTERGYSCEVILTDSLFDTIDGQEVTEADIKNIMTEVPHYIFTFDIVDGELVVTSFTEKA